MQRASVNGWAKQCARTYWKYADIMIAQTQHPRPQPVSPKSALGIHQAAWRWVEHDTKMWPGPAAAEALNAMLLDGLIQRLSIPAYAMQAESEADDAHRAMLDARQAQTAADNQATAAAGTPLYPRYHSQSLAARGRVRELQIEEMRLHRIAESYLRRP